MHKNSSTYKITLFIILILPLLNLAACSNASKSDNKIGQAQNRNSISSEAVETLNDNVNGKSNTSAPIESSNSNRPLMNPDASTQKSDSDSLQASKAENPFSSDSTEQTASTNKSAVDNNAAETHVPDQKSNIISHPTEQTKLEEKIVAKYYSESVALKDEYQDKLRSLALQYKQEYDKLSADDKIKEKKVLSEKYVKPAMDLQSECEEKFSNILASLKKELNDNGFPSDDAIADAKKKYKEQKSEFYSQLIEMFSK